jgi:hypothetical protein
VLIEHELGIRMMKIMYYFILGQLVALVFLIVSKQKGWGLFWRPFLTALAIVSVDVFLGGLATGPSAFEDSVSWILWAAFGCILIHGYLFPVMGGPILLGVTLVGVFAWTLREARSLVTGKCYNQDPAANQVSKFRYSTFLLGLVAITVLNAVASGILRQLV